jgi:glycosyltransferase involved in cell wall biosynthesis
VEQVISHRRSAKFLVQAAGNLVSSLPMVVSRYRAVEMQREFARLKGQGKFDHIICDFLFPAPNMEPLEECVIFQHNVESVIWKRYVEQASDPIRRWYFQQQSDRLWRYERDACRRAAQVIAVSDVDAEIMRREYQLERVAVVPTGVDVEELTPRMPAEPVHDLVFIGSMDWMPNVEGVNWFLDEILPLILRERPETTVAIVGRKPPQSLLARASDRLRVTGTVPDVRPFLWESAVSMVPLRIGSGTRLKIFEAMAAKVPVVSTTIGAEGLVCDPGTIGIADTPSAFAAACLELLTDRERRDRQSLAAWEMVRERYSWRSAAKQFESILAAKASRGPSSK